MMCDVADTCQWSTRMTGLLPEREGGSEREGMSARNEKEMKGKLQMSGKERERESITLCQEWKRDRRVRYEQ